MKRLLFVASFVVGFAPGFSAVAEPSITVNVNGTKYICSEAECPYICEGRLPRALECDGVLVAPNNRTGSILLVEKQNGQILGCLAAIQEKTDFLALAKCSEMRRQICD